MTHHVTGIISDQTILEALARARSLPWPVALTDGLAILPLREIDLSSFQSTYLGEEFENFQHLSNQLFEELRRISHDGPLLYFETEYWGGLGGQGAAVFRAGELIFGPRWDKIGLINQALKLLGVSVKPSAYDEFETVGLHLHRNSEGWLNQR